MDTAATTPASPLADILATETVYVILAASQPDDKLVGIKAATSLDEAARRGCELFVECVPTTALGTEVSIELCRVGSPEDGSGEAELADVSAKEEAEFRGLLYPRRTATLSHF